MKARTLAIARGDYRPPANEPKVWFRSAESFARLLSEKNRALLHLIAREHLRSLSELAERSGRSKSNLSRTLTTMARYGLVVLRKGPRGTVLAQVPYQAISLVLPVGTGVKEHTEAA
jgi:predicted transcriptional regulator